MKGQHIRWDEEWIISNFDASRTWSQFAKLYDNAHGTETKYRTIEDKCHRMGITHWKCEEYTREEIAFVNEFWPIKGSKWCAEHISKISGKQRSDMAIRNKARELGLKASKELLAEYIERNAIRVRKPIGTIRMDAGSRVPLIKTKDGWKTLASEIHGKPQKGNVLCFLDGNKENCKQENIVELSRRETAYMTHNKFWSKHPEITKTGVVCVKLMEAFNGQ